MFLSFENSLTHYLESEDNAKTCVLKKKFAFLTLYFFFPNVHFFLSFFVSIIDYYRQCEHNAKMLFDTFIDYKIFHKHVSL